MAKVEVYSGPSCPYCVRAKDLLKRKGVDFDEYDVKSDMNKMAEMQQRFPGARTIPQIFINDKHIGGCDDLHALDAKGELDALLAQ